MMMVAAIAGALSAAPAIAQDTADDVVDPVLGCVWRTALEYVERPEICGMLDQLGQLAFQGCFGRVTEMRERIERHAPRAMADQVFVAAEDAATKIGDLVAATIGAERCP